MNHNSLVNESSHGFPEHIGGLMQGEGEHVCNGFLQGRGVSFHVGSPKEMGTTLPYGKLGSREVRPFMANEMKVVTWTTKMALGQ
jgi:hypothetical protein